MSSFFKSFYGKLSVIFLLLLILLGSIQVYLTFDTSVQLAREADQKLNRNLASNMAAELEPLPGDSLPVEEIKHSIHYMMVFNPRIEIYLLDPGGRILAFFADPPQKVKADSVDLDPIRSFIQGNSDQLILGPDPRQPGTQKPFSASTIQIGNRSGYLYIILAGEQYQTAFNMVQNSYIVRSSVVALVISIVATAAIGLIVFRLLTRRLRRMTARVNRFEEGDLETRIEIDSDDELGQLARSFNSMADTLVTNIEKLRRNDRMRRDLIANISHDLRSPLTSIQGYLETILIKGTSLEDAQRAEYLETILKNTTVLSKLVEDLFELSKLEAKQVETEMEPFSIAELCQDVMLKFKPEAEKKEIRLQSDIEPTVPFVNADIRLTERALSNLLRNAIHYTGSGGDVVLSAVEKNGRIRIEVSDTGCGIPEEDLPYVFDRFYRGSKHENRSKGSSGLGLAIAQKILELHDSSIRVESEEEIGTTFYFDLKKA
ncbi:MAG: ATP-binding protein [Balneolaceae bacterium]|nr:ATP-binding protein [Balneolaceae bacterium]